jgi:hypothetical protein
MNNKVKLQLQTQERALIYIRDALSFYLTDVRVKNNLYNIIIIVVSMSTAFFETLKTEFEWDTASKSWLQSFSTILPIGMSTFIAFISSMMKFERLSDKMEDTTKSIEKCHYAINKQREIRDCLTSDETAITEANLCFREAIMNAEMLWLSRMDPKTKRQFLKRSDNIHAVFDTLENDEEVLKVIEQSFKPDTPIRRFAGWNFLAPTQKTQLKKEAARRASPTEWKLMKEEREKNRREQQETSSTEDSKVESIALDIADPPKKTKK